MRPGSGSLAKVDENILILSCLNNKCIEMQVEVSFIRLQLSFGTLHDSIYV